MVIKFNYSTLPYLCLFYYNIHPRHNRHSKVNQNMLTVFVSRNNTIHFKPVYTIHGELLFEQLNSLLYFYESKEVKVR